MSLRTMILEQQREATLNPKLHVECSDCLDCLYALTCKANTAREGFIDDFLESLLHISWTSPEKKVNGRAPNIATRPSSQPTASDKMTVLRIETPTTVMTPRFGPVKDLIALGSVVRRDTREPEEFGASSKIRSIG
jgi:hypothetical protein